MTRRDLLAAAAAVLALSCATPPSSDPLPDGVSVRLRDHREAVIQADGSVLPLALGDRDLSLCLQTPAQLDTSQWEARFRVVDPSATDQTRHTDQTHHTDQTGAAPADEGFAPPRERLDSSLCFAVALPSAPQTTRDVTARDVQLCGELRDRFDDRRFTLPCQPLRVQGDDSVYRELTAAWKAALGLRSSQGLPAKLAELDAVAQRAEAADLPFLSVQIELISVYFLRHEGTPESLQAARERLDGLPAWLRHDAAVWWAAQAAYERALLDFELDPKAAWQHLKVADRLCLAIAHPIRFVVRMKQAEILSRVGAVQAAVDRLAGALDDCGSAECNPQLLPSAHANLAWLLLIDPRSGPSELERAGTSLGIALAGLSDDTVPHEVADLEINRAYLLALQGADARPVLARVRELLEAAGSGASRGRLLARWADLVEGLAALRGGELERALAACKTATRQAESPYLAAWARSCAGQVHAARGELEAAARAFEDALLLHEHAGRKPFGPASLLRTSQRSQDAYRAARVAVDRDDPAGAWQILAELDRRWLSDGGAASIPDTERQGWIAERDALLRELMELDVPASGARRRQRASMRRTLIERLQEHLAQGEDGVPARADDADLRFRAVAVGDEILLLHRRASGEVTLAQRTPFDRETLRRTVADVADALDRRDPDDGRWRELTLPLARALVPPVDPLPEVTTFALHGVLQGIPLAALPVPDLPESPAMDGQGWFGERTAVALVPAGVAATAAPAAAATPSPQPLFVVDPRSNLPSGAELGELYGELFPHSRVLQGAEATAAALQRHLVSARWLHIDAHGLFDPAFPELSSLQMSDQPLTLAELADLHASLAFANLSGCRTGSAPATADSGRYGLAGLFARRGAAWVIASRTDLEDRLAAELNQRFYRALADDRAADALAVPRAFRRALQAVRERHPATAWASLLLLRGPVAQTAESVQRTVAERSSIRSLFSGAYEKQSPRAATPSRDERDSRQNATSRNEPKMTAKLATLVRGKP
ncbi:MAG: CHAT domain-containing protein [Acidobacteriota bacterium]